MSVGYDIQTGRIQFGSSKINDSTSALMTMNKGALINGDIRSKTDIHIPASNYLYIGENGIKGLANNLQYFSTIHTLYSQTGTLIATFDSATGITFAKDFIPTWTKNNSNRAALQYEKTNIVSKKMPGSVSGNDTIGHGLNFNQIRSWSAMVKEDTTNVLYSPGNYYGAGIMFYAKVDSLYCRVETGSAAYTILNDSVFFRIVYTDFDR